MSETIELFLSTAKADINAIDFVEVKFKTKSGYGYNLRNNKSSARYYYHMKANQTLNVGDKYLIVLEESKRCSDRLDVVHAIKITSVAEFMQQVWVDKNLKSLLINDLFDAPIFKAGIKKKLVGDIPKTAEQLNDFLKPLPDALIKSLSDAIPLQLLPGCIEYLGTQSTIKAYFIEKGSSTLSYVGSETLSELPSLASFKNFCGSP